ncbi:MAG: response regulator transcription factor [Cyanobacteria bacterium RYN_339]|nr:response regulator transcription factor [Cyanobacteria bacterium RYN_339]
MPPVRILLADDHSILRMGLKMLIGAAPDLEVVGEAADGEEAVALAQRLVPDVVLMDISMPKLDGIKATKAIKRVLPGTRVLMLTMHEDDEYLFRTIQAGGSGYVLKKAADDEVLDAIRHVAAGGAFLRPAVTTRLMQDYLERVETGEESDSYNRLTDREREILGLIAGGNTNAQIGTLLVISVRTVESHRANIMEKLGLQNRAELVKYALRKGLLD